MKRLNTQMHSLDKEVDKVNKGKKNILLLGSSSFFNDLGSEMIAPVMPLYISALGGGGIAVGLASGLREGLSSIFKVFGGWLSDVHGKSKRIIFFGYFFSFLFKIFLAMANSWQALITFLSFERFGKLRDAPRDVIIARSLKEKGKSFGWHQMMDAAGGIFGTLLVTFLLWSLGFGYQAILIVAAIVSGLSLIPIFFVREPKEKIVDKSLIWGIEHLCSHLKYFILVSVVFTLANFGISLFLILRAQEITGSIILALLLYAIFKVVFTVLAIPFSSWSDKVGRKKVLVLGYLLFLITCISLIFVQDLWSLIIIFILYGIVYAATQASQRAYVSDMAGEMKGTALGSFHSAIGIINIPAGIIAGVLWNISYQVMFVYLSVVALVALVMLVFVKEKNHWH